MHFSITVDVFWGDWHDPSLPAFCLTSFEPLIFKEVRSWLVSQKGGMAFMLKGSLPENLSAVEISPSGWSLWRLAWSLLGDASGMLGTLCLNQTKPIVLNTCLGKWLCWLCTNSAPNSCPLAWAPCLPLQFVYHYRFVYLCGFGVVIQLLS